ncbi:hypothetical protein [Natrarchaeobaculum sulfurireducens]|nr:hypothetical protein [Natrarchaeobaculum sulfurireducens]
MKSVRVSLGHDPEALAPIHEGICASPDVGREVSLGGQAVDGVETIPRSSTANSRRTSRFWPISRPSVSTT